MEQQQKIYKFTNNCNSMKKPKKEEEAFCSRFDLSKDLNIPSNNFFNFKVTNIPDLSYSANFHNSG